MPCAPTGLWMWAASPSRKQRRSRKRCGAAVMDAVGREPCARLDRQPAPASSRSDGSTASNCTSSPVAQRLRQDADDAPMVLAAHREQQMKAVAPEIDVELVGDHRPGHLDIGDEEHMLVGRARESDAVELAHGAARAVAAADPGRADRLAAAVRQLERRGDAVGAAARGRRARCSTRPPRRARAACSPMIALIVVLAEDQDVGIGRHQPRRRRPAAPAPSSCLAPTYWRRWPILPSSSARSTMPSLCVDLQRARLHAERPRLLRPARHGGR